MRRFERQQDIEAFLTEIAGTLATKGMPGLMAARAMLLGEGTGRLSLEDRWITHLEQLGAWFIRIRQVRSSVAARGVAIMAVQSGHLTATHGKARVEIDVDPPAADERAEGVRAYLDDRVGEGRSGLRDALRDGMATRSDILLPAPRTIRARCTCPDTARVCKHALAVLVAFGARLDAEPELLVRLRGLEALDVSPGPLPAEKQGLTGDLAAIFGIDLADPEPASDKDEAAEHAPGDPTPAPIPPSEQPEVRREYLQVLGLQSRTIDAWRREGVLGRTDRPGVYVRTPEANRRISRYLAR